MKHIPNHREFVFGSNRLDSACIFELIQRFDPIHRDEPADLQAI